MNRRLLTRCETGDQLFQTSILLRHHRLTLLTLRVVDPTRLSQRGEPRLFSSLMLLDLTHLRPGELSDLLAPHGVQPLVLRLGGLNSLRVRLP